MESISQNLTTLTPGVGSSYRNAWKQLRKYFLELFLIGIIYIVISLPSQMGASSLRSYTALDFFGFLYSLLIGAPVVYGVSYAYLKAARGDKVEIKDMFESFKNYWNAVLANLLVLAIVVLGFILLVIPGVIFAIKLSFTPYLIVDRKMQVIEAVKESWRMTNGHSWQIFLIGLLALPIIIAGLIILIVGVIPAGMWIALALPSLYHAVSLTDKTSPPAGSIITTSSAGT